jgi:hypothetical protein
MIYSDFALGFIDGLFIAAGLGLLVYFIVKRVKDAKKEDFEKRDN